MTQRPVRGFTINSHKFLIIALNGKEYYASRCGCFSQESATCSRDKYGLDLLPKKMSAPHRESIPPNFILT